jgi:thiamine-monophosphate kinase
MDHHDSVRSIGEFGLIDLVTGRLPQGPGVAVGPGDDAAVISAPDGRVVATTDLLAEGRHFRREWSTPYDVGGKAAAQNLADVAAMGARPTALLVALALPADLPVRWPLELADGLRDECARVGASVVGGDVVRDNRIVVAATALGDLAGREPVLRSGARPGDVVAVAGTLGRSAAGLDLLEHAEASRAAGFEVLLGAHRRPQPPYDLALRAPAAGATAMIDISDGLLQDLGHVARASGVRIDLDLTALEPDVATLADAASLLGRDAVTWVLTGGEDHAFAACLPATRLPEGWRVVGRVHQGTGVTVAGRKLGAVGGFDHFRNL